MVQNKKRTNGYLQDVMYGQNMIFCIIIWIYRYYKETKGGQYHQLLYWLWYKKNDEKICIFIGYNNGNSME